MYRRVPRLFDELALARVDGSYARVLARLAKAELVVLDDLGLGTPTESQRNDLLEVLEDRYGRVSTVVTSQLELKKWHEWIGEPTIADAIWDRLVHNAYKIDLTGPSGRKEKAAEKNRGSDSELRRRSRREPRDHMVPKRAESEVITSQRNE
jgi:DNA replication protein DnaC